MELLFLQTYLNSTMNNVNIVYFVHSKQAAL